MGKVFEAEDGIIRAEAPTNPPIGQRSLYAKADGWYDLDSDGVESKLSLVSNTDGEVKVAIVDLTAAQILTMFDTPILIIPGQVGKIIQVANMVSVFTYGGTPYAGGGFIRIAEETSLVTQASTLSAANLAGSVDFIQSSQGSGTNKTAGKGIVATNQTAAFTLGNGTIRHIITYQYITI